MSQTSLNWAFVPMLKFGPTPEVMPESYVVFRVIPIQHHPRGLQSCHIDSQGGTFWRNCIKQPHQTKKKTEDRRPKTKDQRPMTEDSKTKDQIPMPEGEGELCVLG